MVNCVISSNAATAGGGVYYGKLLNCAILGNIATASGAPSPGGAYQSRLVNCTILGNRSFRDSGGVYGGYVVPVPEVTIFWEL
jgi:hypothetical protein